MSQSQRQKSFEESLIALEADIERANTLASLFARGSDGAYLQIRLSYGLIGQLFLFQMRLLYSPIAQLFLFQMRLLYSPIAQLFLFLVQWADCSLAWADCSLASSLGLLGLLYITIYEVYSDGETKMSTYERRASFREFKDVIYPSLQQLGGITEMKDNEQKLICKERYKKPVDEERRHLSKLDLEREKECGVCMEIQTKVELTQLPNCSHAMCLNCYREWHARSKSCPFCRASLKRVGRENLKRLFNYIYELPPRVPEGLFYVYDSYSDSYVMPQYRSDRDPEDRGAFGM